MPEMSILGWFHTVWGIAAILIGVYSLVKFNVIRSNNITGKIYLILTLITAASALMIYQQGGFNVAHLLAVATLGAVAVGYVAENTRVFRGLSAYLMAASYSATFLFHMIPAITDGLRRLPVGDPFVDRLDHPLILNFYMLFLAIFIVGVAWQCWNIRQGKISL